MTGMEMLQGSLGIVLGLIAVPLVAALFRAMTVEVEDEEVVLALRFGKLVDTFKTPGLHSYPARILPWVKIERVSLQRDFRSFEDVHVNDVSGTTVMIDLWVEFRVTDAAKALFAVEDWDRSLRNLVVHTATSILCDQRFEDILTDRTALGERLRAEIVDETARWGVAVEAVFLRNVKLLPEVSRQVFQTIAAGLERAKAEIDENGRLVAAKLDADTASKVAELVAEAKGQYPAAIGRALARMDRVPEVRAAYEELYALSVVRPHRVVAFRGFEADGLRAIDAAMLPADGATPAVPALTPPASAERN